RAGRPGASARRAGARAAPARARPRPHRRRLPAAARARARSPGLPEGERAVDGRDDRAQAGRDDAVVHRHAPARLLADLDLHVCGRAGVRAGAERVLVVVEHARLEARGLAHRPDEGIERAVALGSDLVLGSPVADHGVDALALVTRGDAVAIELERHLAVEVLALEGLPDVGRGQLAAALVGDALHHLRELHLHAAREVELVVVLEHVGDAALARLRVDADDRLVGPAHVVGVDRQVGHVPDRRAGALVRLHALLDRVLVRAGEGRVDQLAGVGMPRVDGQLGAEHG